MRRTNRVRLCVLSALVSMVAAARAANFTTGTDSAIQFGVHEIVLRGDGSVSNPFDTAVTVTFTPLSGAKQAKTVHAFYDGGDTWRARVYVSEAGKWNWSSVCQADERLDGQSGAFSASASKLRGRLLPHPKNPRQWMTENGRWFLNLNDTAYFLLCRQDGRRDPVSDEQARRYVRDDVARGITSIRCYLASRAGGGEKPAEAWKQWFFEGGGLDRLRLDNLGCADRRLRMLLDEFPDVAVQLILFPLERYGGDEHFWAALTTNRRERLLRQLIARFAAYPQIYWLIVNDAHYGEKFPNNNALARQVGEFFRRHDPWEHPRSTGHARTLPFLFGAEDWATYVHIENKHDLGALECQPYLKFAKPVFLGEDRYEQDHGPKVDPANMRYWQRRLFWAWLLSGGSANYGGRWWSVAPYSEIGTRPDAVKDRPNVTFRAPLTGLDSVKFIRDYFEKRAIELSDFVPDHALVRDLDGATEARAPKLMRRGYEEYLIYHPNAAADGKEAKANAQKEARLRLDLRSSDSPLAVEWYRAEDGRAQEGEMIGGGKQVELAAPWPGHDVVLRLNKARKH